MRIHYLKKNIASFIIKFELYILQFHQLQF